MSKLYEFRAILSDLPFLISELASDFFWACGHAWERIFRKQGMLRPVVWRISDIVELKESAAGSDPVEVDPVADTDGDGSGFDMGAVILEQNRGDIDKIVNERTTASSVDPATLGVPLSLPPGAYIPSGDPDEGIPGMARPGPIRLFDMTVPSEVPRCRPFGEFVFRGSIFQCEPALYGTITITEANAGSNGSSGKFHYLADGSMYIGRGTGFWKLSGDHMLENEII